MTQHLLSTGADYAQLAARFRPIFAEIAAGAVERAVDKNLRRAIDEAEAGVRRR